MLVFKRFLISCTYCILHLPLLCFLLRSILPKLLVLQYTCNVLIDLGLGESFSCCVTAIAPNFKSFLISLYLSYLSEAVIHLFIVFKFDVEYFVSFGLDAPLCPSYSAPVIVFG